MNVLDCVEIEETEGAIHIRAKRCTPRAPARFPTFTCPACGCDKKVMVAPDLHQECAACHAPVTPEGLKR